MDCSSAPAAPLQPPAVEAWTAYFAGDPAAGTADPERLAEVLAAPGEALELIRPLVPEGMSLADFALRWILDHDAVSSVIAGVSRPDQAVRNAAVSDLPPLGAELHAKLRHIYEAEIEPLVRCPI